MKSLLFAAFVWQLFFPAAQEAENVMKILILSSWWNPADELYPSRSVPRSSKILTDCHFLNEWTYCFFLEEPLAAPAAERWWITAGLILPQQPAKLEMTRNKRGEETSFPRELSGKLLSIHTDGENIDRVTLSHSQSAFCCILSEQSQNICCFLCVCSGSHCQVLD